MSGRRRLGSVAGGAIASQHRTSRRAECPAWLRPEGSFDAAKMESNPSSIF